MKTNADTTAQNMPVHHTALRMPLRMRSYRRAPKFWAMNVEKALPKSCAGM